MTVAITYSRAQIGIDAPLVTVEADISGGLPQILIVGLPETAVKESKDRVKAALENSGFKMPSRRVIVNLAPADLPKQGGRYDLAIAMAILGASDQIDGKKISQFEFLGELALDGQLRGIKGVLPAAIQNQQQSRKMILPQDNNIEATFSQNPKLYTTTSLKQVADHVAHGLELTSLGQHTKRPTLRAVNAKSHHDDIPRLSDIRGQHHAKRALCIAAAGAHNLIFIGPPGSGKTMLASRLPNLMPPMNKQDALATASIQSIADHHFDDTVWGKRPFRTPHHSASAAALVGGGNPPRPGEISLAHNGVLFMDELPEFARNVLEVLREPLESGRIVISRAKHQVTYPARFQLVSAMNPCPCGYFGDDSNRCQCTWDRVEKYKSKVSGPLLDRIDLHVDVPAVSSGILGNPDHENDISEHSEAVERIKQAQRHMMGRANKLNAHLSSKEVERDCTLTPDDQQLLDRAMEKLGLSARGYYKILKLARTIADMEAAKDIARLHLTEALSFRKLDKYRTS